ncbi:MAG: hypothetical protein F4101_05770 [Nitrospira sp. SB0673_bin_12]|nr:hypothetical protein [Nitrospira sp. SB0673_bin_12]
MYCRNRESPGISRGMVNQEINVSMRAPRCPRGRRRDGVQRLEIIGLSVLLAFMSASCTSGPVQSTRPLKREFPKLGVFQPPVSSAEVSPGERSARNPVPFSLEDRMAFGTSSGRPLKDGEPGRVFSFRAREMPLVDALRLFSRANRLNIVVEPGVEGVVTVDFQGLALEKAMSALLDTQGYYWEKDGELIVVRRLKTRMFTLDYIRLERSGEGRNKAQVTSGSGRNGGQDAGEVILSQQDQIKFWEEIEAQIGTLLSTEGRFVVNRLSGTIQVTDLHRRVQGVATFLANVRNSLYRQVEIQARIYEIALRDDYSLGVDWSRIDLSTPKGSFKLANVITAPAGGFVARAATAAFSFNDGDFEGVIQALQEQGDVQVVSQPRILTLNNQPALIKVGTDQSFFTSTTTQGTAGTGNIVTEQVRTVTSGLVLSVTPQVSQDGWVMMDVSPIITRLTDTVESQNGSTAPVLEVKQSGGLVRVRDGQLVIIGGLIQEQLTTTERKVPLLGDIPVFGTFFSGTYQAERNTELVIFLMPRILRVT